MSSRRDSRDAPEREKTKSASIQKPDLATKARNPASQSRSQSLSAGSSRSARSDYRSRDRSPDDGDVSGSPDHRRYRGSLYKRDSREDGYSHSYDRGRGDHDRRKGDGEYDKWEEDDREYDGRRMELPGRRREWVEKEAGEMSRRREEPDLRIGSKERDLRRDSREQDLRRGSKERDLRRRSESRSSSRSERDNDKQQARPQGREDQRRGRGQERYWKERAEGGEIKEEVKEEKVKLEELKVKIEKEEEEAKLGHYDSRNGSPGYGGYRRGHNHSPHHHRHRQPNEGNAAQAGDGASNIEQEPSYNREPQPEHAPNFEPSGLLVQETNTKNGVVLKYNESADARIPIDRWRLYVFKQGDERENKILHLHRSSCFLVGKDPRVCEVLLVHPSISQQHAAIQFRLRSGRVKPYLIDLQSTNGTTLNKTKIETSRYYELRSGDSLQFGRSSRDLVLLNESVTGKESLSYTEFADADVSKRREEFESEVTSSKKNQG